jgi:hypothetical protein
VKRFARNFVDVRYTIGEILLPLFFVVFAMLFIDQSIAAYASAAWLVILGLMFGDAARIARGVRTGVRSKFGDDEVKGVAMYAVLRAWQMRRLRLPKPLLKHGENMP